VAEYRNNLDATPRRMIKRQIFQTLRLAVLLTIFVVFLTHRLVFKKIAALVEAVRKVTAGELGAQVDEPMPSELKLLGDTLNSMSRRLERVDRERELSMEKARRIEEQLHPSLEGISEWPVAWSYRPATDVAGDFFDIRRQGDSVLFVVGDVIGHGVSAALYAAMLKVLFEDAASETKDPADILSAINRRFLQVSLEEDFCTMAVAVLDSQGNTLHYASAGHEPALILQGSEARRTLDSTGPVLGVVDGDAWETTDLDVRPADILFLYTDGLPETRSPDGTALGRERVMRWLQERPPGDLDSLVGGLMDKADDFRCSGNREDDVTVLAARLRDAGADAAAAGDTD
ncbi:MAG: PP2C family protein-serine/threonine phosphatase, partial [Planctomycetota bacterium]